MKMIFKFNILHTDLYAQCILVVYQKKLPKWRDSEDTCLPEQEQHGSHGQTRYGCVSFKAGNRNFKMVENYFFTFRH